MLGRGRGGRGRNVHRGIAASLTSRFCFCCRRIVSASLSHISFIHLAFNVTSLWNLRGMERVFGALTFIRHSAVMLVLSMVIALAMYHVLLKHGRARYEHVYGVGYSAVLFGWMTIAAELRPGGTVTLLFFQVPARLAPFASLLITALIPGTSFIGHLAGIFSGYLISFGLLDWVTAPHFLFLLCNAIFWGLITLKTSFPTRLRHIQFEHVSPEIFARMQAIQLHRTAVDHIV